MLERTAEQVQAALDLHNDSENTAFINENWRGMTYAEGVRAALDWVLGNQTDEDFTGDLPNQ